MCSEKVLAANRQNALNSTGPRTPKGKSRSCLNSTRHGLRSRFLHTLVPDNEKRAFAAFQKQILHDLHPLGAAETFLARRLALLAYKLQRCAHTETLLLDQPNRKAREEIDEHNQEALEEHQRYVRRRPPTAKTPPRQPDVEPLPIPQSPAQVLARAFDDCTDTTNTFSSLQRYTTSAELSFHRTLKQLQLLRKLRHAQAPLAPLPIEPVFPPPSSHAQPPPRQPLTTDA